MVHRHKNVFLSLKGREIGFRGRLRQNILPHFAEEIAATSSTDNKACNLPGSPRCTFLVSFSSDYKLVASSHGNHSINISRLSTGEHVQTLTGHPRSPWCVTFHPSSNEILASGCLGGEVRVWDLQGSSEVWQSDNHSMIASLSFHPRDQVLAIATNDQISLWDWRQPVPFASVSISSPLEKVRLVRFSPLGHNLLTGIANAPVDEEEPEYENLDVQHEAYQSTTRHSRHGVPDHLNPYSRPARLDATLQGSYSADLPSSHGPSASLDPRRPLSPEQNETLEEARQYAAAVTLTALGLRRVNPARNASHDFSYSGWRPSDQRQADAPENLFLSESRHQSDVDSSVGTQNDPRRFREEIGVRSGITSWRHNQSGEEMPRGVSRPNDDASNSELLSGAIISTEDGVNASDVAHPSVGESRSYAAPVYVNMDVTNGDEIRVARTSVSIPEPHTIGIRTEGIPHVARLQQLPPENQTLRPSLNQQSIDSSEGDQEGTAPEEETRPLDLVAGKKYGTEPFTSSQHVKDLSSSSSVSKDCHSPEAKRHCPDFSDQNQESAANNLKSHDGSSSSSGFRKSTKDGYPARQRLSFTDAEVSSAIQDMGPSTSSYQASPDSDPNVSLSLNCNQSSGDPSPQSTDARSLQDLAEAATSQVDFPSAFCAATSADSEAQMQPALQSQTLSRPQAAVMHRDSGGISGPPRAFTAHLGTIPHTAPPISTSQSDNSVINRTSPQMVEANASHSVNSTSELDSTSRSDSPSPHVHRASPVDVPPLSVPVTQTNSSTLQIRPPQFGPGLGLQRGMRALHFRTVDRFPRNGDSVPGISSSSPNNPLDLSIGRAGSTTNQPGVGDSIASASQLESMQHSCPAVPEQSDHRDGSDPETRQEVPLPSTADQNFGVNQQRQNTSLSHATPPVLSQHQADPLPPTAPGGMDLSIPSPPTRQNTSRQPPPYTPPVVHAGTTRCPSYIPGSYTNSQQGLGACLPPAPIPTPLSTVQPSNPFPASDAAARYRRYNLWRSPGLHRQRLAGSSDSQDGEPLRGESQMEEPRAGVAYGARRVAPLHTRRHLHVALLNQPSRQMTDMERMDMAARVQRRLLRQSRQGPLRAQLGRLSGQFSGHHHHPRNSIFDETYQPPPPVIHATINRAIASAFAGRGETAVANNIGNTTYRLQWWDFSEFELPDISDADHNVIVPHCKLHNDASCDVSLDGHHLAAFVPSPLGFPDDGVLAIYSLMPHNFGDVLFTKSFGPNAITVSISPLGGFVMVGLASRKLHLHMGSKQLIGMIYKLHKEGASEDSLLYVCDVDHACSDAERRHHVSVNTVKWIPRPGGGLVYGTNRGDLRICSPSNFTAPDDLPSENYRPDYSSLDDYPRHDLVHRRRSYTYMYQEFGLRNLALHHPSSSGSPGSGTAAGPERRARGTQTPQRELYSTATQTDEQVSQ